jgi:ribulose bisphosphate carboxylase small subunit
MKIVALFEPKVKYTTSELNSKCHEKIDNLLKDSSVHIIVSENFNFAIKYLEKRRFRNCTVYHKNSIITSFKKKGGFTSFIELEECMKQESTEQIYFV